MRRIAVLLALTLVTGALPARAGQRSLEVSRRAGLGQVDLHGDLAAVLQRDEGAVALVDLDAMKVLGRFEDGARLSLDGDVVFSDDGKWVFYARQTEQFSLDGVHVLDVSDPRNPRRAFYTPAGGAYRLAFHAGDSGQWLVLLDAIAGLVVYRFVPETGVLVPVYTNDRYVMQVGGPASAGLALAPAPGSRAPLLYVTTGRTGLDVYDFSSPATPALLGSWDAAGLADIEVRVAGSRRIVYAAQEYWFEPSTRPVVHVLDASKPAKIRKLGELGTGDIADDAFRVQGMTLDGAGLLVATSTAGLVRYGPGGDIERVFKPHGAVNEGARVGQAPYVMDVEVSGRRTVVTDAATGFLHLL